MISRYKRAALLGAICSLAALTLLAGGAVAGSLQTASPAALPNCDTQGAPMTFVVPLRIPIVDHNLAGARKAGKECNADLTDVGPQAFDPPAAVQALQDSLAAGTKALAFDALPEDIYTKPVSRAKVPVAAYIAGLTGKNAPLLVAVNDWDMGIEIANLIINRLPKNTSGEVVVGNCAPGLLSLDTRIKGIKLQFSKRMPSVKVKGPLETHTDPSVNYTSWQGIIQANPNSLAFMGVCDQDLPSLAGIKKKNQSSKYMVAGAEVENPSLRGIRDGYVVGCVGQNPYLEGYIPIRILAMRLAGTAGAPTTGWIDPGLDVITKKNVEGALKRQVSTVAEDIYYAPIVRKMFSNLKAYVRPMSDLNAPTLK